jgi:hypothetical protein
MVETVLSVTCDANAALVLPCARLSFTVQHSGFLSPHLRDVAIGDGEEKNASNVRRGFDASNDSGNFNIG